MIDFTSEFGRTVKQHIDQEYFIWLITVDSHLSPQPRPVWFIWDNDSFLIFSEPKAHKVRHIQEHPGVALQFNTADKKGEQDVIVIHGTAVIDSSMPSVNNVPAYIKKYRTGLADLKLSPEEMGARYSVAIRVTPGSMRGW